MKLNKHYALGIAAILLASCGQEEEPQPTPVAPEQVAPVTETTPPPTEATTPIDETSLAETVENPSSEEDTDESAGETRDMKQNKSDAPGEVEETVPAAAEEEEAEPEEEEEAAPELPTTVLVKANNTPWVRKNEPKPKSSAVITQPKKGILYRETAARAAECFSYGDEHVLVSAYSEEHYSSKSNYSFWDSRTGDLIGRFRLNDDYKYPMKQSDGTYAMVPHNATGKDSVADTPLIHIIPHELNIKNRKQHISGLSDYDKFNYLAQQQSKGMGIALEVTAVSSEEEGLRLAESASSANGLGVQFSWPGCGEGMCAVVLVPSLLKVEARENTITYLAHNKLNTINLNSLTFNQNNYTKKKSGSHQLIEPNVLHYDLHDNNEIPNKNIEIIIKYLASNSSAEDVNVSNAHSSITIFNAFSYPESICCEGLGIVKDNKILFLNKNGTLSKSRKNSLDWSCSLLTVLDENDWAATILIGGNGDRFNESCGVHKISLDFRNNKYTVEQSWDCVKSDLKPLWLGKMNLLLLPASEQHYRIVRVQEDNSSVEVGNLYLTHDAGYAIVLPNGHYAGSPGCESILNYGDGTRVVGLQTLAPWRNRPAEVLEALGGNADDIAALQATTERWLKKQGFDPNNMPQEPELGNFPHAEVELPKLYAENKDLSFKVRLHATQNDIVKLEVRANGVLIPQDGIDEAPDTLGERHVTVQLPLAVGQNWIEVTPVDSACIAGATTRFRTIYKGKEESDLYVVAIGVSDYDDDDLDLQFAAKDAQDIINTVETKTTGNKHTLLLKDKEMTGKADLEKVRTFLADAKEDDRVILYIAGHGMLDSKLEYHFAPAGFNPSRVRSTGISMKALTDTLQSTKARHRLLLLDTCHSGSVGESDADKLAAAGVTLPPGVRAVNTRGMKVKKTESKLTDTQTKRYMEDMFAGSPEYRGINIVAASAGAEFAMESGEWNNGVFSYSIMKTLNDAEGADINGNKVLSVAELQLGVQSQVLELTRGAQRPAAVALDNGDMELIKIMPAKNEKKHSPEEELHTLIQKLQNTTYQDSVLKLYQKRLLFILPKIADGYFIDTNLDSVMGKSNGTTALHNACGLGNYEIIEWLLRNGANVHARATNGATVEQCIGNDPDGRIRALIQQYK